MAAAKDTVGSYLKNYAEPHAEAAGNIPGRFQFAAVIPAFDEADTLLDTFQPLLQADNNTLLVLVINCPHGLNDAHEGWARTAALAERLNQRFPAAWRGDHGLSLHPTGSGSGWLAVDCFSEGRQLPAHRGVGLARKIAADVACGVFYAGKLRDPWICSTDADVTPPPNLFEFARSDRAAALTFPFQHVWEGDEVTRMAARLYDFYLHYHVWGLASAASPYAHYSIGSTLAFTVTRYAQVRGFPRRAAGEDFHLLAKLAKLAPVAQLDAPEIAIRARLSRRVPFGTGPAIAGIAQLASPVADFRFMNPGCYVTLGNTLRAVSMHYADRQVPLPATLRACMPDREASLVEPILRRLGAQDALRRALRDASDWRHFRTHWNTWFDALKTQQFLRRLRSARRDDLNLEQLLVHADGPRLEGSHGGTGEAVLEAARTGMARETRRLLAARWSEACR